MKLNRVRWSKHPWREESRIDFNSQCYSEVGMDGWNLGPFAARKVSIFGIPIVDIDGFDSATFYLSIHPFYKVTGERK